MVIHWLMVWLLNNNYTMANHAPLFTIQYPKPLFDLWISGETMDKQI
jgi:hypothetical protein